MKKLLIKLTIFGIIAFIVIFAGSFLIIKNRTKTFIELPKTTQETLQRGEYVARLSDCAACHTAPGGYASLLYC